MLSYLVFGNLPGWPSCVSLFPIIFGVCLSSLSEIDFDVAGFICAFLSCFAAVFQATYTKKCIKDLDNMDFLLLHFYTCTSAAVLLIPWSIWDMVGYFFLSPGANNPNNFVSLSANAAHANATVDSSFDSYFFIPLPAIMIFLSIATHYVQNVSSLWFLNEVTTLSHQVATVFKRLVTIVGTIFWFKNQVSLLNYFGILIAMGGFLGYSISNSRKPVKIESNRV